MACQVVRARKPASVLNRNESTVLFGMSPLRLVFLGSDAMALPLLDWLAGEGSALAQVVAVFTQPDRPVGRGQQVVPNTIKAWALARNLPVHQPEQMGDDARERLVAVSPDVALVMAYGHLLREDFIGAPRLGTLNLHTSLLPKYRGASPIQTAIASGEHTTGVTLMRIVRRLDAGPIADVERVSIATLDTALEVEAKLAAACPRLLARALPRLRDGSLAFTPQDDAAATYCRRLEKEDGALDFSAPASVLAARINGLFPWPGCSVELNGQTVKFGLADALPPAEFHLISEIEKTGTVWGADDQGLIIGTDASGLLIGTGGGALRVRRLQRPGGRMLPAQEFLRGFAAVPGTSLASRPMRELVSPTPFKK